MLLLTRKIGERIYLKTVSGEIIWIQLKDIDRGKVSLGITAAKDIEILREEVVPTNERLLPHHA